MDDEVLWKNRRGLTSKDTVAAVTQLRGYPFSVGLQMMTGMYGSDREKDLDTARQIISLKPDFVRIYPTIVLKQTVLYHLYSQGSYQPMELEESVALSAELLDLFDRASIPVIRLGLMAGEEVNEKEVIGPFHSSYRELVESYRILREIERQLEGKTTEGKTLRIVCPKRMLSKVIGNRKKNRKLLEEKYGLSVVITPSDTFSSGLSVTLI